ncbi:MAG: hypothetical protein ACKPKO_13840, partial [Candidatus Fonsibacter sp.]
MLEAADASDSRDITAEDVEYSFDHAGNNAAGADQWKPRELKSLGKLFCKWIAVIYSMAETGRSWPNDLRCARIAYISKEDEPSIKDLLKYRFITILPAVYRGWPNMKYRHCADWAEGWADEGQFSARRARGAQEAWWLASLDADSARAEGREFVVPLYDMAKCYDMIPRKLAYAVLRALGAPERVVTAWQGYLDYLEYYNNIG